MFRILFINDSLWNYIYSTWSFSSMDGSYFELTVIYVVIVLHWGIYMPYWCVLGEIWVIHESRSWLSLANSSPAVVSKWVISQFLIIKNVVFSGCCWIWSTLVNEHSRIHCISNSLLIKLKCFFKLSRRFRNIKQ